MTIIAIILVYGDEPIEQAKSTFIVGIIIASVSGFSVLYNVDYWSLLKQSMIHFVCMFITVFPCLILSGWFTTESVVDIINILGIFIMCGIILWAIFYLIFGKIFNKQ